MSQSQPDRLDRIEATLERASQQLDNQVAVNAELRQSVNSLIQTANQHQENFMVIVAEIRNMRQNMEQMQSQIVELREDTRAIREDMRVMESQIVELREDTRNLHLQNSRILDRLEGLENSK